MAQTSDAGGTWDHKVTKGASWSKACTWVDADGNPIDITGGTITVAIKTAADSSGASAGTATGTVTNGAAGIFTVSQTVSQVNAMTAGSYWWSGKFTPTGSTQPVAWWSGKFTVEDVLEA